MDKLLSREAKKQRPFTCLAKGIKKGMQAKAEWMRETGDVLTALRSERDSGSTRESRGLRASRKTDSTLAVAKNSRAGFYAFLSKQI